jgi:hypothetical protein
VILDRMNSYASAQFTACGPPRSASLALKLVLLLGVQFERRFAPILVRWLYVGPLVLIGAVTLFGLFMAWWLTSWADRGHCDLNSGLVWTLGAPLVRAVNPPDKADTVAHRSTVPRVIPCAVVPLSGKRARLYGWSWSSPLENCTHRASVHDMPRFYHGNPYTTFVDATFRVFARGKSAGRTVVDV